MMWSSASAEVLTISRYCRCSGGCGASSSSSVIPSTPFIGVRISWLMLATNSLLARLAFSAAVLASRSAAVWVRTRRRSVTIHASDTATRPARPATIHTTRAPVNHGAASITLMPDGPATNRRRPLGTVRLATRVACTAATPATSTTLPRSSRGPGPPGCSSSADSAVGPASISSTSSSAPTTCWRSTPRMRTRSPSSSFFSRSLPGSRCASGSAARPTRFTTASSSVGA